MRAVADDVRKQTLTGGNHAAADNHDAIVATGKHLLNQYRWGELPRSLEGHLHLFRSRDFERDRFSLPAIQRFNVYRPSEFVGGLLGLLERINNLAFWNRNAVAVQTIFCFILVLGQLNRNRTGLVGHRCLDVMKILPIAKLNAISRSVSPARNVSSISRFRD